MGLLARLNDLSFLAICATGYPIARTFLSYRDEGPPPLREGGCLVVANHISYLDPVILQVSFSRRIRFLMTEDFYDRPALRWFFRWQRALPVSEDGSNLASLRVARDALRAGSLVGLFPEGQLSLNGEMGPGRDGAAVLASLARVPIQPLRIRGSFDVWRKGWRVPRSAPVFVRRGELIPPPAPGRSGRDATTRRIMEALRTL